MRSGWYRSTEQQRAARRAFLKAVAGVGIGLPMASIPARAQGDAASLRPKEGDLLVKANGLTPQALSVDDVPVAAGPIMVWSIDPTDRTVRSGSRFNRVMLVRFDPEKLSDETRSLSAGGVVAYTAICTHSGCEVADWLADEQLLYCSCHSSKFDPKNGARVVDGPAPRSLPALPLKTVQGQLTVAGPFTGRVGFESP